MRFLKVNLLISKETKQVRIANYPVKWTLTDGFCLVHTIAVSHKKRKVALVLLLTLVFLLHKQNKFFYHYHNKFMLQWQLTSLKNSRKYLEINFSGAAKAALKNILSIYV